MPAPKGSKNAKAFQEALVSKNRSRIEKELIRLKNARANFDSLTALSEAVAKETGLSAYTIRRNQTYRLLITKYISEQRGRSGHTSRAETVIVDLRHKVAKLEISLSNALAENARLHAFVKKRKDPQTAKPQMTGPYSGNSDGTKWEENCIRTYYLVQAILSRAEFVVDLEEGTIGDPTGIDDNEIVAGSNIAKPYIEWVKRREINRAGD